MLDPSSKPTITDLVLTNPQQLSRLQKAFKMKTVEKWNHWNWNNLWFYSNSGYYCHLRFLYIQVLWLLKFAHKHLKSFASFALKGEHFCPVF